MTPEYIGRLKSYLGNQKCACINYGDGDFMQCARCWLLDMLRPTSEAGEVQRLRAVLADIARFEDAAREIVAQNRWPSTLAIDLAGKAAMALESAPVEPREPIDFDCLIMEFDHAVRQDERANNKYVREVYVNARKELLDAIVGAPVTKGETP